MDPAFSARSRHSLNNMLKPSPSSSLSTISLRISSAIKDKTCPICLSHIARHRPAIISPCLHAYCLGCLLRWSNYKRTCPLCNSPFDSYFSTSYSLPSSTNFRKHRLLPLHQPPSDSPRRRGEERYSSPLATQRVLRRTREEINESNRRSRPVPRRRSFGRLGSLPSEVIAEQKLHWRASIYRLGLQAVPFSSRGFPILNMVTNIGYKETVLHRIEPWIRRELAAILQDPDPSVIVHVVTSLYLSSMEKKPGPSMRCPHDEDAFLAPLQLFLHEWAKLFWHELRCFAGSSFSMDTYDEVVEYRKSD